MEKEMLWTLTRILDCKVLLYLSRLLLLEGLIFLYSSLSSVVHWVTEVTKGPIHDTTLRQSFQDFEYGNPFHFM